MLIHHEELPLELEAIGETHYICLITDLAALSYPISYQYSGIPLRQQSFVYLEDFASMLLGGTRTSLLIVCLDEYNQRVIGKVSRPSRQPTFTLMSCVSKPVQSRRQRGESVDLNITRDTQVAHRSFLRVQDAWHREEAVDVGDGTEVPPELATMLTVS